MIGQNENILLEEEMMISDKKGKDDIWVERDFVYGEHDYMW